MILYNVITKMHEKLRLSIPVLRDLNPPLDKN